MAHFANRLHKTVALSSGEAELNALVAGLAKRWVFAMCYRSGEALGPLPVFVIVRLPGALHLDKVLVGSNTWRCGSCGFKSWFPEVEQL